MVMMTKTLSRLNQEGVPTNIALPKVTFGTLRTGKEVAIRLNILGIFHAISDDGKSIDFFGRLLEEQKMLDFLSSSEKVILKKGFLSEQAEIDLSWYQESLYALSWCLGIMEEMVSAKDEADLSQIFAFLPPETELTPFLEKAKLIDRQLIKEELDYYYGLHWAVRHPENWSLLSKLKFKKYKISVIRERRKALEWVVDNKLSWDDIALDT